MNFEALIIGGVNVDFAIKNSVKIFLKEHKKRMANGVCEALDTEIEALLKEACKRAETNGRTTVMPLDL